MGLFDSPDSDRLRAPSHSQRRASSPNGTGQGYFVRPSASGGGGGSSSTRRARSPPTNTTTTASSFFSGLPGTSSRGIFSSGGGNGGASYYKRRPRSGYIAMLMQKLQRMVKELWVYARRHPVKAFFAVVVPLLSAGGAIGGLMKQFGVKIPGVGGGSRYGGSGGRNSGSYYDSRGYGGGMNASGGGGGWMNKAGSLMQIAKAFV